MEMWVLREYTPVVRQFELHATILLHSAYINKRLMKDVNRKKHQTLWHRLKKQMKFLERKILSQRPATVFFSLLY